MPFRRFRAFLALALLASTAGPAHADIRAFNAAVQSGDYLTAAAEADATWRTFDHTSTDAAAIAREFAWVAMLAGDPSAAMVYTRFLLEQGPTLPAPDPSPAISRVLHDWASLAAASSVTARARLMDSLRVRAAVYGRDLISARAAQALYMEAWSAGDWAQTESAAMLAVRFFDDLAAAQSPARYRARRMQAQSNFMRTKSPDAYANLYDMAGELHDLIAASGDAATRERLGAEYHETVAWADAIYGALSAGRRQLPARRFSTSAVHPSMADLLYPAPGDAALPRCRLTLARGAETPGFPFVQRFKEFSGEVIVALDVQPNGGFSNARVLAAAPAPDFAKSTLDVVRSWRWRIDGGVQPPGCRMPRVHLMTFEFALGR
jgi:hypothetical protein